MSNAILRAERLNLVEALDRALDKGVALSGDITLSVAGVDLVFLGLRALLASVETAQKMHSGYSSPDYRKPQNPNLYVQPVDNCKALSLADGNGILEPADGEGLQMQPTKADATPETVERGLAKLVLTLIEMLRKLMEKQALRRTEGGSLSDEEIERLGQTFMRLENRMKELKGIFGLKDEDLNLDLGPLGNLM